MTQNSLIIKPDSKMDNLTRDIAVLTTDHLYSEEEVAQAYELTPELYAALAANPDFQKRVEYHRRQVGDDTTSRVRAQAKLMAGSLLRDMFEMAKNPQAKYSDRLKAAAAIVELADMKPKQEQQFSGMVLNVSFGSGMPSVAVAADKGVIEHE